MSDDAPDKLFDVTAGELVKEIARRHNGMVMSVLPRISKVGEVIVPQVFFSGGYLVALAMSLKLHQYMDNLLPAGPTTKGQTV